MYTVTSTSAHWKITDTYTNPHDAFAGYYWRLWDMDATLTDDTGRTLASTSSKPRTLAGLTPEEEAAHTMQHSKFFWDRDRRAPENLAGHIATKKERQTA